MTYRGVLKVVAVAAAAMLGLLAFAGPAQSTEAFDDVDGNEFFGPGVDWMETQGLTTGVGGTEAEPSRFFEPFAPVDRAQLATFLWRMAGSPEPTLADDGFTDTDANAYYGPAVRWLRQQGYTTGIGGTPQVPGTTYEPHTQVDRAQAITLLWRYGGQPGPYGPHGFRDVDPGPPPTYFENALRWAAAEGITTGYGGSDANPTDIFVPFEGLTRGQMAALVWRYAGNPAPNQQGCLAEGEWPCEDDTTPTTEPPTTTTTPPTTTTTAPPDPEADLQLSIIGDEVVVAGEEALYTTNAVNEGDATIDEDITVAPGVWDDSDEAWVEEADIEWWDGEAWVDDPIEIPGGTIDPDYDETIEWRVVYPEAGDHTFFVSYLGDDTDEVYATDGLEVTVLPRVLNVDTEETYDTMTEAIGEADEGETLLVRGSHTGVIVIDESVTLESDEATLAGSFHVATDGVTIDGFEITDLAVVPGAGTSPAGIYLQGVSDVEILNNVIVGDGDGAGILTTINGAEAGVIEDNVISDVTQGIFFQGVVNFDVAGNEISDSVAGIATDTVGETSSVAITGNTFTDNEEGIGLGGPGVTIVGNSFLLTGTPDGEVYVTDWVDLYGDDLETIVGENAFDPDAEIVGNQIVPQNG